MRGGEPLPGDIGDAQCASWPSAALQGDVAVTDMATQAQAIARVSERLCPPDLMVQRTVGGADDTGQHVAPAGLPGDGHPPTETYRGQSQR